ncbi:hypothetical protein BS47DRAFT_1360901 [Hydnum rufescens UP504]|uniref:Uncharacterized protein n=1 Tax=Hydnum rufescens UP504 TaxID=1448309 RepID=A0A9P6B0X9_9AGAM|nr:hypothetical protein BS47DRAFT_1360901 [Hydnum rufescens UP504]
MPPNTRSQQLASQERAPQEQHSRGFPSNDYLRTRIEGLYLGTPRICDQVVWTWNADFRGRILTLKTTKAPAILHDGGFDKNMKPPYAAGWSDEETMGKKNAQAHLCQVPIPTLLGHNDFKVYRNNIREIEELKKPRSNEDYLITSTNNNQPSLRLTHKMFSPTTKGAAEETEHTYANNEGETSSNDNPGSGTISDPESGPRALLATWPVSEPNKIVLKDMVDSGKWETNPLHVFVEGSEGRVPPSQYQSILPGAIAQIAFKLKHVQVPNGNALTMTFSTIIQEIIVLKKADPVQAPMPRTPTKRTLPRAPSFSPRKRGSAMTCNTCIIM